MSEMWAQGLGRRRRGKSPPAIATRLSTNAHESMRVSACARCDLMGVGRRRKRWGEANIGGGVLSIVG